MKQNKPIIRLFILISIFFVFQGCATRYQHSEAQGPTKISTEDIKASQVSQNTSSDSSLGDPPRIVARIPVVENPYVEKWIQYFTHKERDRFQRFIDRGETYRDVVENMLEVNELPAELYYLAMIESGFNTHARSHAKAVGVWQFISPTAKRYGLQIDRHVDERRDPIRATEAAAKYLRDLHNVFGSWYLAMAAYNAGEMRILRAVFKARSRNFWELVKAKALPRETAEYVPKFLAVVMIGQNPEKYGFKTNDDDSLSYPDLKAVTVPGALSLKQLSSASGVEEDLLKRVNPQLLQARTPVGTSYELWVPSEKADQFVAAADKIKSLPRSKTFFTRTNQSKYYVVKRGDNLSTIAHRFNLSLGYLKRINGLHSNKLYVGARLRTKTDRYQALNFVRYRVRRGDNLILVAKKFRTSVSKIKAHNKIRSNSIRIGQILKIETPNL